MIDRKIRICEPHGCHLESLPRPVCSDMPRCKGCPYPAHGFISWRANNECLKTDMEKIAEREKKRKNESADM